MATLNDKWDNLKKAQENHRKVIAALEESHTAAIAALEKSRATALNQAKETYKSFERYEKDQEAYIWCPKVIQPVLESIKD